MLKKTLEVDKNIEVTTIRMQDDFYEAVDAKWLESAQLAADKHLLVNLWIIMGIYRYIHSVVEGYGTKGS
ncbi:hypothetical protein ACFRAM_22260 [Paenibacillus sp. NPDC056722]|uniref:hypothetical protein n=1 Tax=Paenibacillus sp. NPDC056722 TaxID=3345924 RepID=UPI0036A2C248